MTKIITMVIIVIIVVIAGYLVFGLNNKQADNGGIVTGTPTVSATQVASVKTFTVIGKNFSFSPTEIKVKKGDTVRIVLDNQDGTHDWVLDEFNVHTPRIQTGQTAEVTFVADKTGTFEYYCSVGNHRAMGMKGNFVVE